MLGRPTSFYRRRCRKSTRSEASTHRGRWLLAIRARSRAGRAPVLLAVLYGHEAPARRAQQMDPAGRSENTKLPYVLVRVVKEGPGLPGTGRTETRVRASGFPDWFSTTVPLMMAACKAPHANTNRSHFGIASYRMT